MARIAVTTQAVGRAGAATTYTGPNVDGDIVDIGRVALHVKNGSGSPITVTVQTPVQIEGLDLAELTVSVPAAGERFIGPLPASVFAQPVGNANAGKALVDYSAVTSVTRAVISL